MKRISFLCLALVLLGCSSRSGFVNYRHNPFQFPYPEYYMKADVTAIQPEEPSADVITIDVFDISFDVDKMYADEVRRRGGTLILKKSGRKNFIILKDEEKMMGCNKVVRQLEKDFCSAFASTKEYFEKLFLLTPGALSEERYLAAGNRWIVHQKGNVLENVKKISIYTLKNFTVFRKDFKSSDAYSVATELVVFGDKNRDSYITMAFTDRDETLIRQILETVR